VQDALRDGRGFVSRPVRDRHRTVDSGSLSDRLRVLVGPGVVVRIVARLVA
jgi:hypothetical protein